MKELCLAGECGENGKPLFKGQGKQVDDFRNKSKQKLTSSCKVVGNAVDVNPFLIGLIRTSVLNCSQVSNLFGGKVKVKPPVVYDFFTVLNIVLL